MLESWIRHRIVGMARHEFDALKADDAPIGELGRIASIKRGDNAWPFTLTIQVRPGLEERAARSLSSSHERVALFIHRDDNRCRAWRCNRIPVGGDCVSERLANVGESPVHIEQAKPGARRTGNPRMSRGCGESTTT